ncbi:MAG: endonuclease Q family protein [Candidatus Bathyarchaeota archaeon]|nr:endonuclease Q family protein [Candidatus Bathyarchaeota archaeon]
MRVIADLHIHSKYSRATSQKMNIDELVHFAQIKGLNMLGTGDFTHPKWMSELKSSLIEVQDKNLYKPSSNPASPIYFMVTSEVCTIFEFEGKVKKIHHVILTPSLEVAEQISDRLSHYGDMTVDGRPILKMSASELVEEIISVSDDNVVFPAHIWTPWFSLFGAFSGFDRIEDCYEDMTKHIFALETGLSSDPPMNWRLSALDRYSLVSNSDAHSPWPWRIGREANVFELLEITYNKIVGAIREKDNTRFIQTIEVNPAYGKYHWTGHRGCGVSTPPKEAIKLGNICPVCKRRLTEGVEQRVEALADRPADFHPEGMIGYIHLLPLHEILSAALEVKSLSTSNVWGAFNSLISRFGSEFSVLLNAQRRELSEVTDQRIAEAILRVREGRVKVIPGYDGVYGKILIFEKEERYVKKKDEVISKKQVGLEKFM